MSEFLNTIPKNTLKNTVIIFASDHGEAFGEHDMLYHANSLFQEETHIPLMMRIPGVKPQRISEPVSLLDIAPTVLSFFNIPKPESFIGEDLKPLFAGGSLGTRAILSENGSPFFFGPNFNPPRLQASLEDAGALGLNRPLIEILSTGVRVGSHTAFFLYPTEQKIPKKHMGLHWYNLENDPTESENLATGDVTSLPAELREPLKALDEEVRPLN
jgi:arylsulfatase A-like enzyme